MVAAPRALVVLSFVAALVVFSIVQDRITAAGARQYVTRQREARAGRAPLVAVDEVMRPAVERSVRRGLLWGGVALVAGLVIAEAQRRRRRR